MKTPTPLLRSLRRRVPRIWLERLRLVCNGIVLMFHEVEDDSLRRPSSNRASFLLDSVIIQLRRAGWEIVTLDEGMYRLRAGDSSRRFAVLTFDDGYRDTLRLALPILERHGAPFTVYVPTGAPTRELHSWWLGLRALFERHDEVVIAGMERLFTCNDIEKKRSGYQEVHKWVHEDYRRQFQLDETFRAYKISLKDLNCAYFMDEAELRGLARHPLATIGAHADSHQALSTLEIDQARDEMRGNRVYLEQLLGVQIGHFAYPYGTALACGPREFRLAAEIGFRSAVTTRYGPVFPDDRKYPYALPRVAAASSEEAVHFADVICALGDAVRRPSIPLARPFSNARWRT